MPRWLPVLAPLLATLGSVACSPTVADGARSVFSVSQICTAEGVTVKARPDLAPHSVLKGVTPPPGVSLDSVGDTYEITGCNKKGLYVCGHPVVGGHADPFSAGVSRDGIDTSFNTDQFTLITAHAVEGGRITSAVVCQPASQTVQ